MNSFPKNIKFIYEWRSYQQKVLSQLDHYLLNRHLHLIAPPGSGKTVVGLEVVLRLNAPTLILAPTLAIKNQWCERFVQLFLNSTEVPDWISMDLQNPKFLTITTYQALHSLFTQANSRKDSLEDLDDEGNNLEETVEDGDLELEDDSGRENSEDRQLADKKALMDIESLIKRIGFKTLVLDEAHHLRTEWWKSTLHFRNSLHEPNIVALTATPPYDVSPAQWERYIELCGPIDLEISVPELVKEQDLCPHQDYIYFSYPSQEERQILQSFRENVQQVSQHLIKDASFVQMLEQHPWIAQPNDNIESILSTPAYFSSMLIFLKKAGSPKWKNLVHILGTSEDSVPELNLEWLEELLTGCLFRDEYTQKNDAIVNHIKKWLSRIGAIERRKVYLRSTKKLDRTLVNSVSKLNSIKEIVQFEASVLKDDLRLVVLTDYIRLPDLPKNSEDEKPLTRLGVIPIFEKLRRENTSGVKLGVLSGSIAILPASAVPLLESYASGTLNGKIHCTPLKHDQEYVSVQMSGSYNQQLVRIMTDIFTQGEIQVLIGTTALLGEGWDAPSINALILASYVGTFMLSNQMRGRAIRIQRGNENKTSNIWHLVCIDPTQAGQGYDMDTLTRRFRSFVGVSFREETIESGMDRMDLVRLPFTESKINYMNKKMLDFAGRRQKLADRWTTAISKADGTQMVEELKASPEELPREYIFQNTIRTLLQQALALGVWVAVVLLDNARFTHQTPLKAVLGFILFAIALGIIAALPKTVKAVWLLLRHGSVEASMKQVGQIVCQTLHHMKLIKTDIGHIRIRAKRDSTGSVYCWMDGGTTYEQTLFLDALQELLSPIHNPRYLLMRNSKWGPVERFDYHAVPQLIGKNKENAEFFHKQWKRRIGKAKLIFTRTVEGRQQLLEARMRSMSSAFIEKADRLSAWQ